jgi:hypothetical protein
MANFTGRLAPPCPPVRDWGMNLATPPLALRTVALRAYDSAQLAWAILSRPCRCGGESAGTRRMRSILSLRSYWYETSMQTRIRQTTRCAGVKIVRTPCQ